ncbi:MAG: F0F1 ATP synthase subunit A, partial [Actinobacteria bacterium]|nr:F0F1 ATP synthase subunit A [Actinomycetota bacterium]
MEIFEELVEASQFKIVGSMLSACVIIFLLFFIASRRVKMVPHGLQGALEALVDFIKIDIVFENIGPEGKTWLPFFVTLFFFILGTNLIGLIPGSFSATSNINITATLALIVFFSIQVQGVIKHGFFKYIKSWIPAGVPVFIGVFMFPIEFVGQIAKPFSLAIRLFANMFAGHLVLGT